MKVNIIFYILIIFSFLLVNCKKEKPGISDPTHNDSVGYFPNNIGMQWKYFYYDSLSNNSDTVIVEIIGDTSFANDRIARIWEYRFKTTIERKYIETLGDTINIYNNLTHQWINTKFIIPFEIGEKWEVDAFSNDSCYVVENISLTVLSGIFSECYVIKETWSFVNDYGQIYTWFVPYIGIVKKHYLGWSFGMGNYYWELMDYQFF